MTNELTIGLFFILIAAAFVTWLIRGTGREQQIIRDWYEEKQRIREMMREIREEEEISRFANHKNKASQMPIKPLCSGRGCPVAARCHRYQAVIDPLKDMYLTWVPYDHQRGKCEFGPTQRTVLDILKKALDAKDQH